MAGVPTECVNLTEDPATDIEFERDVIPLLEPLRRRAIHLTSVVDAEDLLQETLLKAYAGRHSFQPGTNLRAWLYRIMTNTYISNYRTRKRQPAQCPTALITDRQLAAHAARKPAGLSSAEDQALATLTDPELKAAMQALPEQFRTAVYFADVAGLSYKEIAAIMESEQGTVCSRISRGRKQLRNLLTEPAGQRRAQVHHRHRTPQIRCVGVSPGRDTQPDEDNSSPARG